MTGPSGVDDILKTFEEVRLAEANERNQFQPAGGFSTQPAVAAVASRTGSVLSFDMQSQMESVATGETGTSARRKKRAQPPVGATISLNV
jgi:hypothetical protein